MWVETAIVAGTYLIAFTLFAPALIVQFRGDRWLPEWVPDTLRRRHRDRFAAAASLLWTFIWSVGGQVLVLYLAILRLKDGELVAAMIFGIELLVAAVLACVMLRLSFLRG